MPEACVTVTVVGEPKFELRNLKVYMDGRQIDPATTTIPLGKTITISAELWNTGTAVGSATVYLSVNGQEVQRGTTTVNPGTYIPVGWDVQLTATGTHRICLGFR